MLLGEPCPGQKEDCPWKLQAFVAPPPSTPLPLLHLEPPKTPRRLERARLARDRGGVAGRPRGGGALRGEDLHGGLR